MCRNSQLPLTGKGATYVQGKGTVPKKREILFSFSSVQRSANTLIVLANWWGTPCARL